MDKIHSFFFFFDEKRKTLRSYLHNLPLVIMTVRRIDSTRVQRSTALGHVTIAQVGQGPATDGHATAKNLPVAQITGGDVDVRVIVTDMMMRRGMKDGVLSRVRSARQGLKGPRARRVTAQQRLHGLHRHLRFLVAHPPSSPASTSSSSSAR